MEKKRFDRQSDRTEPAEGVRRESQAANRYRMYAKQARKDGYEKIADFFEETVHNELRHSKIYFEFLKGGMVEITASYPAGIIGTTLQNLERGAPGRVRRVDGSVSRFRQGGRGRRIS